MPGNIVDLDDTGSITVEGQRIAVSYTLHVIEDDAGQQQIHGRVDVLGRWTLLYNLIAAPPPLTLRLADGRHVDVLITAEGEALGSAYVCGRSAFR